MTDQRNGAARLRVTVWGENVHEHRDESVRRIYPDGMHETIAAALRARLNPTVVVRTAALDQPCPSRSGN